MWLSRYTIMRQIGGTSGVNGVLPENTSKRKNSTAVCFGQQRVKITEIREIMCEVITYL